MGLAGKKNHQEGELSFHHGEELPAHRTAPPAAKMGPHLETGGLGILHVCLTKALEFQRDSRPQSSCLGVLRDPSMGTPVAVQQTPHPSAAHLRPLESPTQPSPKQGSSEEAATHTVNIPSSFNSRNQTGFISFPELLSSLFFLFYSFLSCLLKSLMSSLLSTVLVYPGYFP